MVDKLENQSVGYLAANLDALMVDWMDEQLVELMVD